MEGWGVMILSGNRRLLFLLALALLLGRSATAQEGQDPTDVAIADQTPSAPAPPSPAAMPDDKWHFGVTPYIWFAGTHGTAGFNGRDVSFHASFGDVFSYLNIGIMGAAEATKGRWVFPGDFLWMKLSDDKGFPESPLPGVTSIKIKMYESVLTPKVGYRVVDKEKLKVNGTVGIRYWHLGENLSLQPINLSNSQSANWVDVVAGAKIQMPLSPKAGITILGDAGGGGANVDYQVVGSLGYKIKPNIIGELGWRYMDVNYRPSSTFIFDGAMSGIVLGVTFNLK
jgi:hypothetical protein